MRSIWLRRLALSLSIFIALAAHAQPAELLKPVDPKIVAELQVKTNYAFRRQRYFAKRYRVVEIDFSLLERDGAEVTITPFIDLRTTVKAKKIMGPSSTGLMREWVGEIDSSGIPGVARTSSGETVPIPNMPLVLWIRTGDHEVPLKVAHKIASEKGDQSKLRAMGEISSTPTPNRDLNATTRIPLQTLSGQWLLLAKAKRIVIRPIEDDPRYHVIYEEDPEKIANGSHLDEASRAKLRAADEFRRQLEQERLQESTREDQEPTRP